MKFGVCIPHYGIPLDVGRMPAIAAASMRGWEGMQQTKSTPSIFRTFAMAVTPSMAILLVAPELAIRRSL